MRLDRKAPKKLYVLFVWHVFASLALLVWVAPALYDATFNDWSDDLAPGLPAHAVAHLDWVGDHLSGPFDGYSNRQVLAEQFSVVALSHMASGLMNVAVEEPARAEELSRLTGELVRRARSSSVSPYRKDPADQDDLGDRGLYLTHLNLILGVHRHVSGSAEHDKLHTRVSKHLARRSSGGDWHARSYPLSRAQDDDRGANEWPADQAATLASLYLYDKTRKGSLSKPLIKGWLSFMKRKKMRHEATGLPRSAVSTSLDYADLPRGSGLSWTVLYMSQFAPRQARELYGLYREHFERDVLGFTGFREWPEGLDKGMDVDSGPIVLGVGASATGIGVGAARMMADDRVYTGAMRAASTFGLPLTLTGSRVYVTSPLLGDAILFHGTTARPWFADREHEGDFDDEPTTPSGNYILLGILAALILYEVMSVRDVWVDIRTWS